MLPIVLPIVLPLALPIVLPIALPIALPIVLLIALPIALPIVLPIVSVFVLPRKLKPAAPAGVCVYLFFGLPNFLFFFKLFGNVGFHLGSIWHAFWRAWEPRKWSQNDDGREYDSHTLDIFLFRPDF